MSKKQWGYGRNIGFQEGHDKAVNESYGQLEEMTFHTTRLLAQKVKAISMQLINSDQDIKIIASILNDVVDPWLPTEQEIIAQIEEDLQ